MIQEKLRPAQEKLNDVPNLLELHPDVFVEFEADPADANGRSLMLNLGLDFFVCMSWTEANNALPKMIEFHERRLTYNENILRELLEFRERVLDSLNEIKIMSQQGLVL